jgi:hypothetical protein
MLQVEIDALLREGGKRTAQEMAAEETPWNSNGGDRKAAVGISALQRNTESRGNDASYLSAVSSGGLQRLPRR